jgi:hypothetical protein
MAAKGNCVDWYVVSCCVVWYCVVLCLFFLSISKGGLTARKQMAAERKLNCPCFYGFLS